MTRTFWLRSVAALLILTAAVSVASAAPVPPEKIVGLDQVPATAPIVIHLRGAEGTKDRFLTMLKNALPDVHDKVAPHLEGAFKDGIEGRKLKGLAKDGPVFVVFTEMPDPKANEPPKVALVFAVTKYEEFRDGLLTDEERKNLKAEKEGYETTSIMGQQTIHFVDKKGYAIVTPVKEVAAAFTKKQPGMDAKISKELAGKFLAGDIGVFLSMDIFNKDYAEQIKSAKETLEKLVENIENLPAAKEGTAASSVKLLKNVIGPVFQAVEDSQGVLFTVEFRPTGLAFHAQSEIKPGSTTAKSLKDSKPSAFKELALLPGGQMYYTGIKTDPAMVKGLGGLLFSSLNDPDSKEGKAIAEAIDDLVKAGPGVRFDAVSLPTSGVTVYHFADANKAAAAQLKLVEALYAGSTFQNGILKEKPTIKTKAEKYKGFEFNSVRLVWDLEKMTEGGVGGMPLPEEAKKQLIETLTKLLGENMNIWFGTDGKVLVQVVAKDWKSAEKLLEQYLNEKDTAAAVKAFGETRKELPDEATLLGLIDVVQYFGTIVEVMKPLAGVAVPLPANFPAMPEKGKASYVGGAVTLKADRGSLDLFISTSAANEFYKCFVAPFLNQ
jgi:hypothetical protein